MENAAKKYIRALNARNALRKNPPHDVFELQDAVQNYASKLAEAKKELKAAVAQRYAATRSRVQRPAPEGVYRASNRVLVRRGDDGPAVKFWDLNGNASYYLKRNGRNWVVRYGNGAGTVVQLDEYWTPSGLRK